MRREIKGFDVGAFADFFGDLEFAIAIPDEFGLLDFLGADFGRLDVELEALAGQRALLALEVQAAKRSEAQHRGMQRENRQQTATNKQAQIAPQYAVRLVDKGLHFGAGDYNNFSCPAMN